MRNLFCACAFMLMCAAAHAAGPFDGFGGRWVGAGTLVMSDGNREVMKCIATYFPSAENTMLKINVRCASKGFKIDAKGALESRNGHVSGTFDERTYEQHGAITRGEASDGKIAVAIVGENWSARLIVAEHGAEVSLVPESGTVKYVIMTFAKG